MDNDTADSFSDEEENLQGEKSKRHKRICKEIIFKNGNVKVTAKTISSKEKKKIKNCTKKIERTTGELNNENEEDEV